MYKEKVIPVGRYCNKEELIGYIEDHPVFGSGSTLYPYKSEHDQILHALQAFGEGNIEVSQTPVLMPYDRQKDLSVTDYRIVEDLSSLHTTLVSTWMIPKDQMVKVQSEFTVDEEGLHPLSEYAKKAPIGSFITNGGYFVTPNLLYQQPNAKPWNWEKRWNGKFNLPFGLSPFYGFYYVKNGAAIYSTFQDYPNRGHLVIGKDGQVQLLNSLQPKGYRVWVNDTEIDLGTVSITLPSEATKTSKKIQATIESSAWQDPSWQTYAEQKEKQGTHLMVLNQGQGTFPQDVVVAIWKDIHPIPNAGYILSFPDTIDQEIQIGTSVRVEPILPDEIADAQVIYALGVSLIENGNKSLNGKNGLRLMESLKSSGLTHPSFQLSQESIVLSPYVRVPSHILIETKSYIGGILCNGRYEYSLGASLLDEIHIIELLQDQGVLPEPIQTAVKADGGSGAKITQVLSEGLKFGNLPAPGARNDFGDGDSNFYHGIAFQIKNATK